MSEPLDQLVAWGIPAAPLIAAVLIAFLGPLWFRDQSHRVCVAALALSVFGSLWMLVNDEVRGPAHAAGETHESEARPEDAPKKKPAYVPPREAAVVDGFLWMNVGEQSDPPKLTVDVDLRVDAMTALMLCTVTFVSLLVAIYAAGYMHGDPGYPRFFAALSLFVFSMCMLVLAGNFLVLFVFWEAVGLCSYLLIGFWYQRPTAAAAAKKAFVVNRIGDFGFLMGLFLIWTTFDSLDFDVVLGNDERITQIAAAHPDRITLICLLLFVGAMGKSAQFPLHVWLPDAMEGPTPVSALIHAATMVTAGVYMVARCTPLFLHAPEAQLVVAGVGAITALMAAIIGLTQYDLKRVLAYSTVSQLGLMFLALGSAAVSKPLATAAVTAAMFHLFTHAFFKALLFLGAGSVMHAMGDVIDMRRFGGLRKLLPKTHLTFLCGSAALAGFPLLSGFWSKDEILAAVTAGTHEGEWTGYFHWLWAAGVLTSLLTAFYTFRAYFLTFWGEERVPDEAGHHAHESPSIMTTPLAVLAVFAVLIGGILGPTGLYAGYLHQTPGLPEAGEHHLHWDVMGLSALIALAGIGAAAFLYLRPSGLAETASRALRPLYALSFRQFYLDQLFYGLVVWPLKILAEIGLSIERFVIDGLLDLVAWIPNAFGRMLRPIQNGLVQSYAVVMLLGLAAILASMLMRS